MSEQVAHVFGRLKQLYDEQTGVHYDVAFLEMEIDRLRGVVEALAAADPVDTSFAYPRCWHCGGESPNEHATTEHWLEHEDDCNWAAAVSLTKTHEEGLEQI